MLHIFTILYQLSYSNTYLRKLTGNTVIENCLQRLNKLTQQEARIVWQELMCQKSPMSLSSYARRGTKGGKNKAVGAERVDWIEDAKAKMNF